MSSPYISVIVPFRGHKYDLKECLLALSNQDFTMPFEIIIVESRKDPETESIISGIPNAHIIASDGVMLPGQARNIGVRQSKAPLLAFTDADCAPLQGWLSELYNSLLSYEIVIGPVLNLYPFHPFASVDNLLQFIDFQKYGNTRVSHFPACNLGMKKEIFVKSSGFPENLLTGEDVLFSEGVIKSGMKVFYNKNLIVKHSGRRDLAGFMKHNHTLGYYRAVHQLKLKASVPEGNLFIYSFYFSLRRLAYITIKTLQWNPAGLLRLFFYFPFLLSGLYAWGKGFYDGNRHRQKGSVSSGVIYQDNL